MGLRDCRRGCLGFNPLTGHTSGHDTIHGNFFMWRWPIEPLMGDHPPAAWRPAQVLLPEGRVMVGRIWEQGGRNWFLTAPKIIA